MNRMLTSIFISILLISTLYPIIKADNGSIIYVDDDNINGPWDGTIEHPYQHIQDAIDNASIDDTIFVFNGIYYEHIVINISINLVGESRDNTIINGGHEGDICVINADEVTIRDFQLRNSEEAAIRVLSSNNILSNFYLHGNRVGMVIEQPSKNNIITDSYFYNNDGGMILEDTTGNNIYNNKIKKIGWDGIYLLASYTPPSNYLIKNHLLEL